MTKFTHSKEKVSVAPGNRWSNILINSSNRIYFFSLKIWKLTSSSLGFQKLWDSIYMCSQRFHYMPFTMNSRAKFSQGRDSLTLSHEKPANVLWALFPLSCISRLPIWTVSGRCQDWTIHALHQASMGSLQQSMASLLSLFTRASSPQRLTFLTSYSPKRSLTSDLALFFHCLLQIPDSTLPPYVQSWNSLDYCWWSGHWDLDSRDINSYFWAFSDYFLLWVIMCVLPHGPIP